MEERLALQAHLLAAATALDEAERKLATALGYAAMLSDGADSELIEKLTAEGQRVRASSRTINAWLNGE